MLNQSANTPGNYGRGIAPPREIIVGTGAAVVTLLRQRAYRAAWHRLQAGMADLWNFHVVGRWQQKAVYCPCCGWQGPAFLATSNWRAITFQSACPSCDSRSRHRGLAMILPDMLREKAEGTILVFAPERIVMTQLARLTDDELKTTDLERRDVDYPGEDIQGLSFPDESFSLIICNHVLEHVPDDERALLECSRILVNGGIALFTVPGDFSRPETWYFNQPDDNGHYRHYGADILERMKKAFAQVEGVDMGKVAPAEWRVRKGDFAFVCRKL